MTGISPTEPLPNGQSRSRKKKVAFAAAGFSAILGAYLAWIWLSLPDVSYLARENPKETALMKERGEKRVQQWAPIGQISEWLVQAVLMGEDAGFYGHGGFDFHEMQNAFERNWEEGRTVRGASTITQQLAKNLFLSRERSYPRKLKEAILTLRLEDALSKERILEIYLNVIEWGDGIYGAEAAARNVFGVSAANLDPAQASLLAAMIPSPLRLDPCKNPRQSRTRQERILKWMHGAGRLSDEEYEGAVSARLWLRECGLFPLPAKAEG